jgi:glycosyltransferase involved in cell wall biosynthesis
MRIAFIAPFGMQPKGTTSARMLPLAQALARRGHFVRIVVPPWDDPTAQAGTRRDAVPGVTIVTLARPRRVPGALGYTYGLLKEALRPMSARDVAPASKGGRRRASRAPQVVHVFKPLGYSGLAGFALSALRVPWVLDTDDWEGPGGWADVNPYSSAQRLMVAAQDALLPRVAGAVTAASRTLEARAWTFGLPRERVFYMPNGVWREKYGVWATRSPGDIGEPAGGGSVIVLYTRFAEFPYLWALEILERLAERHPDARLLVVGSGFFGEEIRLRDEASRRGIDHRLVILGRVSEERVPAYLALGDVALYPMEDNLINRAKSPVKLLEPMLMGLPVVAHRVGQAAEFVGDGGVLVPPGDVPGMVDAVSALLSDREWCRTLGGRARERVWANFNWERLCLAAEEAYRAALAR